MVMNRRQFVRASMLSGGGLLLSFYGSAATRADGKARRTDAFQSNGSDEVPSDVSDGGATVNDALEEGALGDLLSIAPDGLVRYQFIKHEMGQGVSTAMAMIIAEELCADWEKVSISLPDTNMTKFQNDMNGGHEIGRASCRGRSKR